MNYTRIEDATHIRNGTYYIVVSDNEILTWNRFSNQWQPAQSSVYYLHLTEIVQ